jgi:hypothetical protein
MVEYFLLFFNHVFLLHEPFNHISIIMVVVVVVIIIITGVSISTDSTPT